MYISVILPTYNCESTIKSTIESVINQTHNKIELIIVDDCSTDQTSEILNGYSENNLVKIYYLKENSGGPAKPRNFGISKSSYQYVSFIDSDDVWHPKKTKIQVDIMKKYSFQFLSCNRIFFHDDSELIFKNFDNTILNNSYDIKEINTWDLLKKNSIINSSVIVNKKLLTNFNEEKKYIALEDFAQWLYLSSNEIILNYLSLPLIFYRVQENSISNNKLKMLLKRIRILYLFRFKNNKKLNIFQIVYFIFMYILLSLFKKK